MRTYGGYLELSRAALAHNLAAVRQLVAPAQVMAVLKANAYGAGAVGMARALEDNGVSRFAVATVDEGVALRASGIGGDILCLTYFDAGDFEAIRHHDLTVTVFSRGSASLLHALAKKSGEPVRVWIKVDTGLGRLGVPAAEAHTFIDELAGLGSLRIAGVLSTLSENRLRDRQQLARLLELRRQSTDLPGALWSIASSHGILSLPECALDVVRPGVMLLGFPPSEPHRMDAQRVAVADLQPVVTWKSRVAAVKWVPAGEQVGYGEQPALAQDTRVASLMLGWSDGYAGTPQARSQVLVAGRRCPVLALSANTTLVELPRDLPVEADDEVVLLGRQGDALVGAEELARAGAGVYRLLAGIPPGVARIWS